VAHTPLDLKLDRQSDVPLGTQLVWSLRAAIGAGWLQPGDRLPGVRELAAQAGVNVNTARAVYGRLADQGVIVMRQGLGTFVADAPLDAGELRRLAERTAEEAARQGVDPRELAAALFVRPAPTGPADQRRALRDRIAALEADVAALEQELTELGAPVELAKPARRRAPRPRILSLHELEATADELVPRDLAPRLRALLADGPPAHPIDVEVASGPRSVPDTPPELTMAGATWTLRWKA
jgi:DNA-binding transcriptional regulator YhcF (GntR family)